MLKSAINSIEIDKSLIDVYVLLLKLEWIKYFPSRTEEIEIGFLTILYFFLISI